MSKIIIYNNLTVIDKGITSNTSEGLASDCIAFILSFFSLLGCFLVFIMFLLQNSKFFKDYNNNLIIDQEKRILIRRTILSYMISDFFFAFSRMCGLAWWWFVSYGIPDSAFEKVLTPLNSTSTIHTVSNSFVYNNDYNNLFFNQITIMSGLLLSQNNNQTNSTEPTHTLTYMIKKPYDTAHRAFSQFNFAFALSSATWCIFIALAIFTTTTDVKWITTKKRRMYEIIFNCISWPIPFTVSLFLFIFRVVTSVHRIDKQTEDGVITAYYVFYSIYYTIAALVNLTILVILWRHVGYHMSKSKLIVLPKKETKRIQRKVIFQLSLYLIPFVICGTFEMIYWYFSAIEILIPPSEATDGFYNVFYNFMYNVVVPSKGILNGLAFCFGDHHVRNFVSKLCCCKSVEKEKLDSEPFLSNNSGSSSATTPHSSMRFHDLQYKASTPTSINNNENSTSVVRYDDNHILLEDEENTSTELSNVTFGKL